MTHTAKWIVGVVVVLALGIAFCVLIVVGFVYYMSSSDRKGEYESRESEGRELGKTTDQAGCMKEGLARARGIKLLEINRAISNQAFVEACLRAASPRRAFVRAYLKSGSSRIVSGLRSSVSGSAWTSCEPVALRCSTPRRRFVRG